MALLQSLQRSGAKLRQRKRKSFDSLQCDLGDVHHCVSGSVILQLHRDMSLCSLLYLARSLAWASTAVVV